MYHDTYLIIFTTHTKEKSRGLQRRLAMLGAAPPGWPHKDRRHKKENNDGVKTPCDCSK